MYLLLWVLVVACRLLAGACGIWFLDQGSNPDPLEKEMATHSSILAMKIPWTEEPMLSQRVGHD